jgi:oxaloacetate decarboxylase alpha subunit
VTAPIPGTVTRVAAQEEDAVDRGSHLQVLEAMKMDNEICSPEKGVVRDIRVQERDAVRQGDLLVVVEPMEA